jgi:hypothetical protein
MTEEDDQDAVESSEAVGLEASEDAQGVDIAAGGRCDGESDATDERDARRESPAYRLCR